MLKNRKNLKMLAIIFPVLLIGILGYLFYSFQKKKAKIEDLENIPEFSVTDIRGNQITNQNIPVGNKILVYFNPDCIYCQAEMQELSHINNDHANYYWIMFSDQPMNKICEFAENYNLDKKENIIWCNDPNSQVYLKFAMKGVPYFLGYNSENKLVHRSTGSTKIENIFADFEKK